MSKNQTAVEWFIEQLKEYDFSNFKDSENYHISIEIPVWVFKEKEKQAKAMEKNRIIDAHIEGQRVFDKYHHTQWTTDQAEHYYNETYNKT